MINESLVVKTLQGLKASKASGLDNISPRMLKDAAVVVAKPLTRIVIESLSQGTVPSEWKYAKITPLYKKGMSTDMDNYRPSNFGFTSCVQSVGEGCTSSTT